MPKNILSDNKREKKIQTRIATKNTKNNECTLRESNPGPAQAEVWEALILPCDNVRDVMNSTLTVKLTLNQECDVCVAEQSRLGRNCNEISAYINILRLAAGYRSLAGNSIPILRPPSTSIHQTHPP